MSHRGPFLRRLARLGATKFPRWFVRLAPIVIGVVFFFLLGKSRAQVSRNLRRIRGDSRGLGHYGRVVATFVRFAQCLAEGMTNFPPEQVITRGRDRAVAEFEKKRGVILLTAHLGPWDAVARALATVESPKLLIVMASEGSPSAEREQDELRSEWARVVRLTEDPLSALVLLEHLQNGGTIAIQIDRVPPGKGSIETSLFGAPFALPEGPFRLAALTGAPILTALAARTGFLSARVDIGAPVTLARRPTASEYRAAANQIAAELEVRLAEFPTQWFHFVD